MIKEQVKNNKIIRILILLVLVIFITPMFFSLSKYIYNSVHTYYLASKGFYFNSDKLSVNGTEIEIENNWSGAETYSITINLNSKKNDLLFAEPDIDYEVSLKYSDNVICTTNKASGKIQGTNSGGVNEDYFIVAMDPVDGAALANGEQAWVDIEVKSTSPYVTTLTGRLYVGVGSKNISYEIMDSEDNPYIEVNVTNSLQEDKEVTLHFDPDVVLLDMTNNFVLSATNKEVENINNYEYVKSVTALLRSLETTTVKFYKVDSSQDYTFQEGDEGNPVVTLTY